MRVLGVDPGACGGCVVRDGEIVVLWWAWTRVVAGYRLRSATQPERVFGCLADISDVIVAEVGHVDLVVFERLFVPPRWSRTMAGDQFVALAEASGEMIGGLRRLQVPTIRPRANQWRSLIRAAKLPAAIAEQRAVSVARSDGWLPNWTIAEQGALAEAAVMTRWRS